MSKRFVVLVLAIAGCGAEIEGDGAGSDEPTQKVVSPIVYTNGTGNDYFFFLSPMSWSEAQTKCIDVGKMVTLGDASENEFVRRQIVQHGSGAWWIGRTDRVTETFWVWDGNEALRYDNWYAGEPNNFNNEDCATMDGGGGWNDLNCNIALPFVCERYAPAAPATGSLFYSATNTSSANQNFSTKNIALFGGQGVTIGTCGVPGASSSGDTYLRLFAPNGTELAHNDDACDGVGSNFSFDVFSPGTYVLHAGCYGSTSCSGTVAIRQELMAPPIPH